MFWRRKTNVQGGVSARHGIWEDTAYTPEALFTGKDVRVGPQPRDSVVCKVRNDIDDMISLYDDNDIDTEWYSEGASLMQQWNNLSRLLSASSKTILWKG